LFLQVAVICVLRKNPACCYNEQITICIRFDKMASTTLNHDVSILQEAFTAITVL